MDQHVEPASRETLPQYRYTARLAGEIELRWQARWEAEKSFRATGPGEPGFDASRAKYYCLDMFPYPSGAGLHVGHPEGYTATDILCRYRRMTGWNVLHPMGWDAFGLPAEQYAIATGVHPAVTTRRAIDTFRRQLKRFGFSYDWSREFATIDEDYYRWTQWIFLRIYGAWYDPVRRSARPISELVAEFESGARAVRLNPDAAEYAGAGDIPGGTPVGDWATLDEDTRRMIVDSYRLAYVARQTVNWCPRLGTALANEEVIDGRSERGGHPVFRKPMRQWMFRITAYADRLLDGLAEVDWPESTKTMQAEWIGRSEGAEIDFSLLDDAGESTGQSLRVFTTRPDTIFGATYMVVAPEHPLVDDVIESGAPGSDTLASYALAARNRTDVERVEARDKTGVFSGRYARNPATGQAIPVWTSDYVLMNYGTGAIMAVPGQDQRDWDFAKKFGLPIIRTVEPTQGWEGKAFTGDGRAINSGFLDGLTVAEAKPRITEWLAQRGLGMKRVNYRLRDWLFSRQRYWGEPFPIVWDERGQHHPVSEAALPVCLPEMADYAPAESEDPRPLLAKATGWVETTAGQAGVSELPPGERVTRETNTMPGWAGSCWYYLRYCDPRNAARFASCDAESYWMKGGVDLYIGGAEHAVLHLLYARFWHKVLFDLGEVGTSEPFRRLFHQGMILSHAYQREDKSLVPTDEVWELTDEDGGVAAIRPATGGDIVKRLDAASLPVGIYERLRRDGKAHATFGATSDLESWRVEDAHPVNQVIAKMSKSLKNVINPDDVIAEFGADTFRLYEMYMGPLDAGKPWNPRDITGLYRFLQRAWRLVIDEETGEVKAAAGVDAGVEKMLHRTIAKAAHDIERLAFNTGIAALIEFVNAASSAGGLTREQAKRFALVLAPFAPHMGEELWSRLGGEGLVSLAAWPAVDEAMLRDDEIEIPVQIQGKVRARVRVPASADAVEIERLALTDAKVGEALAGRAVKKVIVVPGRMVNVVV